MWLRRRKRGQQSSETGKETPDDDIATECQLFLTGRYAERLDASGRPLPAWVWLNELAHGSPDELSALAGGTTARPHPQVWASAITYLAGELLVLADGDTARLRALQSDVLVPLELRQMRYWFEPLTPPQLVAKVSAALNRCRDARSD
jgi:hypothetical protein